MIENKSHTLKKTLYFEKSEEKIEVIFKLSNINNYEKIKNILEQLVQDAYTELF